MPGRVGHEVSVNDGPNDPFGTNTKETQIADLKTGPLLFPPGTAAIYSNYGFDLLGAALCSERQQEILRRPPQGARS
jgi:CubicO group peptidase (beta-lactamase class C family)